MLARTKKTLRRLHEDETGPNTVEWILIIIVALVLLIAIYKFAQFALDKFNEKNDELKNEGEFLQ